MHLENCTTYMTADGQRVHIAGPVRCEYAARFVYSIGGDWYERETGRYVGYGPLRRHEPHAPGSWCNIVSVATDQSFWRGVEL